ncbi:MAG: hypothetical protein A3E01_10090 [Gammaproteobacteria bacterium RIFCSPHIGHO2_12_FULL_63_22]|nr:MAG: hypothetical protein A3E01_10090 [Gammaproteobacteria bacterium RIFCSPHIGHO2_12_FULL_63_22]
MTKRKSAEWVRTHADLAKTVNADLSKLGLTPVPAATKQKTASTKRRAFRQRKSYRANFVPAGYVPIEATRLHQSDRRVHAAQSDAGAGLIETPWHLRD